MVPTFWKIGEFCFDWNVGGNCRGILLFGRESFAVKCHLHFVTDNKRTDWIKKKLGCILKYSSYTYWMCLKELILVLRAMVRRRCGCVFRHGVVFELLSNVAVVRFCHDYDLCGACEKRGTDVHDPTHVLMKMSVPCYQARLSRACVESVLRRCITESPRY